MKYFLWMIGSSLLWMQGQAMAQETVFLSQGRIEFEKRVNVYAQLEGDDSWTEMTKKNMAQFRVNYYDLSFHQQITFFRPGREVAGNSNRLGEQPAEDNVVYADLEKHQYTGMKEVSDQRFLVKDSTRVIRWKLTDETRNIAGFECRRANALIMDSIYVVAFYTDAIVTPGGPEGFCGLPGMILGIALPHEHVTWFATKVYAEEVPAATLKPPVKGEVVTHKTLYDKLHKQMGDWGKYGQRYIVASML